MGAVLDLRRYLSSSRVLVTMQAACATTSVAVRASVLKGARTVRAAPVAAVAKRDGQGPGRGQLGRGLRVHLRLWAHLGALLQLPEGPRGRLHGRVRSLPLRRIRGWAWTAHDVRL